VTARGDSAVLGIFGKQQAGLVSVAAGASHSHGRRAVATTPPAAIAGIISTAQDLARS